MAAEQVDPYTKDKPLYKEAYRDSIIKKGNDQSIRVFIPRAFKAGIDRINNAFHGHDKEGIRSSESPKNLFSIFPRFTWLLRLLACTRRRSVLWLRLRYTSEMIEQKITSIGSGVALRLNIGRCWSLTFGLWGRLRRRLRSGRSRGRRGAIDIRLRRLGSLWRGFSCFTFLSIG